MCKIECLFFGTACVDFKWHIFELRCRFWCDLNSSASPSSVLTFPLPCQLLDVNLHCTFDLMVGFPRRYSLLVLTGEYAALLEFVVVSIILGMQTLVVPSICSRFCPSYVDVIVSKAKCSSTQCITVLNLVSWKKSKTGVRIGSIALFRLSKMAMISRTFNFQKFHNFLSNTLLCFASVPL